MKTIQLIPFAFLLITSELYAQKKRPIFIGIQPGYTKEPYYEKNELDIYVIPFTLQIPIAKSLDFRTTTIGNYRIGGDQNGFSDIGLQFVMPIYFKKKENVKSISQGFNIGPVIGIGRNLIDEHY